MTMVSAVPISFDQNESARAAKRIPELDGLSGLAILLVILCHYIGDGAVGPRHSLAARIGEMVEPEIPRRATAHTLKVKELFIPVWFLVAKTQEKFSCDCYVVADLGAAA